MLKPGEYQLLSIERETPQGLYLEDDEGNEVLLPWAYAEDDWSIGERLMVLVYFDSEGRYIASTEQADITAGGFASLLVTDVNDIGAFCDWGVSKELFIPYRNQIGALTPGRKAVVYLYLDELSNRLVGSTRIEKYLKKTADAETTVGQEVALLVYARTDLGYKVVINQRYAGLVYASDAPKPLQYGGEYNGYIKAIRDDGKLDISMQAIGLERITEDAERLLERLKKEKGFLPFTDKSDPEAIREAFGMSKKAFKRALGTLYKQRLVDLKSDGFYLNRDRR
jgi:predicted RNA-binding protein (virulence factor B family)